jgi:hypothetical protein
MKLTVYLFAAIFTMFNLNGCNPQLQQNTDLQTQWDTLRPLANPDKGWYHHHFDNGIDKYLISSDSILATFPGMDHLYLRLCWAYLEPEEGKFDWNYIDNMVEKYVPLGYGISFRISTKETGGAPGSVPKEINGIRYATPYWVKQAGAKGIERPEFGSPSWTPEWHDPVYLEKLDNFHRAFAEKYDGKPWVRYIDVGSIGEWGEGHTHFSTRIPPTVDEIKANINIHLKNYKQTQLVVTDDLIYWNKPETDVKELLDFVVSNGITFRDDSPLVKWYVDNNLETWSVSHPHFFEVVYKTKPTVFELEHYRAVKGNDYWLGKNGADTIPGKGVSGAEIFRNAIQLIHPTYIGFHGFLEDWLAENPDLTNELLNLCGYWYFPKSVEITETGNSKLSFQIEWLNKGVAPAYSIYKMRVRLVEKGNSEEIAATFEIEDSGNKNWMPGELKWQEYSGSFNKISPGLYSMYIQLFDEKSGRPVEIGLKESLKNDDGFFRIAEIEI